MGLTPAQLAIYLVEIFEHHERRVTAEIRRRSNGQSMGMVDVILEGRVSVESGRTPSRILEATLLDPDGALTIEPASSGLPLAQMYEIVVKDCRNLPSLGWVECTVFTGPVVDCDIVGPAVTIAAHGRDTIADGDAWYPRTWPRKTRKTSIIRQLLGDSGFEQMRIPNLSYTTPSRATLKGKPNKKDKRAKIGVGASRWAMARKLARSIPGYHLYMDAHGVPILERVPKSPCLTVTGNIALSDPRPERNPDFFNSWLLTGAKPKGQKRRIRVKVEMPDWHPLSPHSLRFNGKVWRNVEVIDDSKVKSVKDARKIIADKRDAAMVVRVQVTAEIPPIPCLAVKDLVRLDVGPAPRLRLDSFTLPLGEGGEPQTLGATVRYEGGPRWQVAAVAA